VQGQLCLVAGAGFAKITLAADVMALHAAPLSGGGFHPFFLACYALLVPSGITGKKFRLGLQVANLAAKLGGCCGCSV